MEGCLNRLSRSHLVMVGGVFSRRWAEKYQRFLRNSKESVVASAGAVIHAVQQNQDTTACFLLRLFIVQVFQDAKLEPFFLLN